MADTPKPPQTTQTSGTSTPAIKVASVAGTKVQLEFQVDELVRRLLPGSTVSAAHCGGCNGCGGCSH